MSKLIAARLGCYGKYREEAWTHLPSIGVTHMEMNVPVPEEVAEMKKKLDEHGLTASSLQAQCNVSESNVAEIIRPSLDACVEFGAKICFVSVHSNEQPPGMVWERMRAVGDQAAERSITMVMETHPDLADNGARALSTMQAIDHPNVRINFDAANIYYYNENCNTLDELEKIVEYVGAVHLKDSTGKPKTAHFPTLGEGIVDFSGLFDMLDAVEFNGPYTMELEGPEERTREEQLGHVADSIAYLRSIGAFG